MAEFRAPRVWHVESRNGYHYATNQFGGFSRYTSEADAIQAIQADVTLYGDTWQS